MRIFLAIFILLCNQHIFAQQQEVPLNNQFYRWVDSYTAQGYYVHSSCKPLLYSDVQYDSLQSKYYEQQKRREKWLGKKLLQESLVIVDTGLLYLTIDPLLTGQFGIENDTNRLYTNTRGLIVRGNIGAKVSFMSSFYESQSFFPSYVDNYARAQNTDEILPNNGIIPGQGRAKSFTDGQEDEFISHLILGRERNDGFDYSMASGYVSYTPTNFLNIRLGHGKHFIGEGYRSLILSDNAFNYPYLRLNFKFGKNKQFEYNTIGASLMNVQRIGLDPFHEKPFEKKEMLVNYINWIPTKWLQLGLSEITTGNAVLFIPALGVNTIANKNLSSLGLNVKVTPLSSIVIYSQLERAESIGIQGGIKVLNGAGYIPNLFLQAEYNRKEAVNYFLEDHHTHYNQSIAHYAGSNFSEFIGIIGYNYRRIYGQIKAISTSSLNTEPITIPTNNIGGIARVEAVKKMYLQGELSYLLNPSTNVNLFAGYTMREATYNSVLQESSNFLYFGIRTSLRNLYYDF